MELKNLRTFLPQVADAVIVDIHAVARLASAPAH
jgi:hypothetical protein